MENFIFGGYEIGSRFGEQGDTAPPRIPRSTPPVQGQVSLICFRFESRLPFGQIRSPFLERPGNFSGSKANFETKTGSLIKNLRYNLTFKTSSCFLKFCTLGQNDSKIHVVSVLAFLLIAEAHSHFYTNSSLICRFYMLGNNLNTTKYSNLPCFYFSENKNLS